MDTEQLEEIYIPEPITVIHIDPETGIEYSYTATATDETLRYILPPKRGAKQIIIAALWKYIILKIKSNPDLRVDVFDILPLVDSLFDDITMYPNVDSSEGSSKFGYTLIPYNASLLSTQDMTDPAKEPPSAAMKEFLIKKMYKSQSLNLAMSVYLQKMGLAEASIRLIEQKESSQAVTLANNMTFGLHLYSQVFGLLKPFTASDIEAWQAITGQTINNEISQYGIDLTEVQMRVCEAIVGALAQTKDRGNLPALGKLDILNEYPGIEKIESLPRFYKNIDSIPKIRLGKRDLVRRAGMDDSSQSDTVRVLQALDFLVRTQFCFYYTRLAFDENNKPILDPKTGKYKKEEVTAVDTLFKVKVVKDESTKEFSYYEISPSVLFLDQKSSFFLLVPFGWREEVRAIVGNKKASSYLYLFLMYLRYQFELKRQKNAKSPSNRKTKYTIERSWIDLALAIRMPETVYKRNKSRALTILEDAYSSAKTLGYLSEYSRQGDKDILVLNPDKYPSPKGEIESEIPVQ